MKRGKERRREEGRKAGRKGKKEGRKGGGEEGSRREGERHYKGTGNFLRRQIQASIFFKPSQTQPLLLNLLLTFVSTQALPVTLL